MSVELLLAMRYLHVRGGGFLRSTSAILAILGITIGVATLISVTSVMNGFSAKLLDSILSINGHITVHCDSRDYREVILGTEAVPGVVSASPVIEGQAMIKSEYGATGVIVRGMAIGDIRKKLRGYVLRGNIDNLEEGIILGSGLAESIGADYGDEVTLISSESLFTDLGSMPIIRGYKVTGIFEVGMHEYDSTFAYIPLTDSQDLFGYGDTVRYIEVFTESAIESSMVATLIAKHTGLRVEDWRAKQGQYFRALRLESDAMFFILTLIIVVAAFNIISGVSALVMEKRGAIAVMRTVGLGKCAVMRIFCMCGAFIGVIGTVIGCSIGVLFVVNAPDIGTFFKELNGSVLFESVAYCLEGISPRMMLGDIVKVAALSTSTSLAAAILPAIKAARQNPVDILRYE